MKNRLQKVFSHTLPESYVGQIRFSNAEFKEDFQKKLEVMYETGSPQEIDGVIGLNMSQLINGEKYPLDEHENISKFHVFPHAEPVEINVETENGNHTWNFFRIRTNEKIILKNSEKSIVFIKFEFLSNHKINFTVKSNPECANFVDEIINTYSALFALFGLIFKEEPSELSDIMSSLKEEIKFWQRARKIEEVLNIRFNTTLIESKMLKDDMQKIEELFLLLIENVFLRENRGFTSFTASSFTKNSDNPIGAINDKFALSFITNSEINIWGVEICTYSVCVAFNHIIDSVKENETGGEVIVSLREDEGNPRYISLRGFKSEEEQEQEENRLKENFSENITSYQNAETFEKLYREKILCL